MNPELVGILTIAFAAGTGWATARMSTRQNRQSIVEIKKTLKSFREEMEALRHERTIVRSAISLLATITVRAPAQRDLIKDMLVARNSPARLSYPQLRALVAERGRPPAYVYDVIRAIAAGDIRDDVSIIGAIRMHLTTEQIERAAAAHGGTADTFMEIALLFFEAVRERGLDAVLRDAGLID